MTAFSPKRVQSLARLQLREAVTRVAKRFPEMRLVPGELYRKFRLIAFVPQ